MQVGTLFGQNWDNWVKRTMSGILYIFFRFWFARHVSLRSQSCDRYNQVNNHFLYSKTGSALAFQIISEWTPKNILMNLMKLINHGKQWRDSSGINWVCFQSKYYMTLYLVTPAKTAQVPLCYLLFLLNLWPKLSDNPSVMNLLPYLTPRTLFLYMPMIYCFSSRMSLSLFPTS